MRKFYISTILLVILSFTPSSLKPVAQEGYDPETETTARERERIREEVQQELRENFAEIKQDPQRLYCAKLWNVYYAANGIDIKVLTRGRYDEIVVFKCPECSMEKEVVEPFLYSEYEGKTGMERIKECGFASAIFKGHRGIAEIVKQVP